jgi:hypothetical protein
MEHIFLFISFNLFRRYFSSLQCLYTYTKVGKKKKFQAWVPKQNTRKYYCVG